MADIAANLHNVRTRINAASKRVGRDPASVKLVAVSKTKPAALIREAFDAGQRAFGENYAQELRDKAKELAGLDIEWHFIGRLQRNKAKYVAPLASMVEAVDSVDCAQALVARLPVGAAPLPCLIEVNLRHEATKSGLSPTEVLPLAGELAGMQGIVLRGLMVIPPFEDDPEKSRASFRQLRELRDGLARDLSHPLPELSMGMSHDFEVAIEEGATIVRVGTAIFGERT